ncbi:MAG: hypothetical protein CME31_27125 [Gimesia sp.]|uniref:Type II secretion system protein n=1 Tax=Gimesia maris TaxID=122 RepID=A0A3D3R5K2_9PLAN|nr:hypothetical protein [Gimesia sp.]HCO23297.1 hypothetical protein [Gimesia maris]|tara:strand:+ start:13933 stop:14355 length:423 start_codon:yes stop_codon:yes gene_type:complete
MRLDYKSEMETQKKKTRQGAVLVIVMICLLLISLVMASLLKSTLMQRRQMLKEQLQVQADWLVESALERAAQRRLTNSEYQGEVWQIDPEELGTRYAASAEIVLETEGDGEADRRLSIQARVKYPENQTDTITRTKKIIL